MERAIFETINYADIFNYPLKINEIHKWLIRKKGTLRQIENALEKLKHKSKIETWGKYYFLPQRNSLSLRRVQREKQSAIYFKKAKIISLFLKIIPWIKLIGVSGGLALNNAGYSDDIDLFIITAKNRLFLSRLLILGLLSLLGQRRKKRDRRADIAGKVCVNILLEEDKLEQKNKDIYIAHEVLQMRPLWERDGIYVKYLESNNWVFRFLPNWVGKTGIKYRKSKERAGNALFDRFEEFAKWVQFKIMQKPNGLERIEEGALYLHPNDCRTEVLRKYAHKLKKLSPLDK